MSDNKTETKLRRFHINKISGAALPLFLTLLTLQSAGQVFIKSAAIVTSASVITNAALLTIISAYSPLELANALRAGVLHMKIVVIFVPSRFFRILGSGSQDRCVRFREINEIVRGFASGIVTVSGNTLEDSYRIYVVLSRSNSFLSTFIHLFKGDKYTHAALSLDKNLDYMFSFSRRWARNPFVGCFKHERLCEGIYKSLSYLPGTVIEIPVSPAQYQSIANQICAMLLESDKYGYNYPGLVGNLFNLPFESDKRFFCSEFVYHVLRGNGICDFGIRRGLIRPQDLLNLRGNAIFEGNLSKYGNEDLAAASRDQLVCGF